MLKTTLILLVALTLIGCDNDDPNVNLTGMEDLAFSGTFKRINSENNISGTATLSISNGYYESTTNLPYGIGAGKLEVNGSTINFNDTLFLVIPALYGPSWVLSGEHQYEFDGENLKIRGGKNVGAIEYRLKLIN